MENNYPTLDELLRMKAQIEDSQKNAMIQNQNLNTVADITKNLSPWGSLGIALGTLGGNMAARYFNNQYEKDLKNTIEQQEAINKANQGFHDLREHQGLWHGANLPAKGIYGDALKFFYPDARVKVSPLAQRVLQQENADGRSWAERYANQIPDASLLKSENDVVNNTTTSPFINDNANFDWRNNRYLSNPNQPYFRWNSKPSYPNGTPKNYLTAYSAMR